MPAGRPTVPMSVTCVSQGTVTAQYPCGLVVPVGPLGGRIGGLSSRSLAGLSMTKQLSVEFVSELPTLKLVPLLSPPVICDRCGSRRLTETSIPLNVSVLGTYQTANAARVVHS